jgi:hypothetical protein
MMKPTVKTIAAQPSWVVRSETVELAVTQLGGHMAPVMFYRDTGRPVQPYYISPWQEEGLEIPDPVLVPLRGDFFCLPFGAPSVYRGRRHVCHGEAATKKWTFAGLEKRGGTTTLTLTMRTSNIPGRLTKRLSLIDGQNVVYSRHVIEGHSGEFPLGHHATLAMPDEPRTVRIATSPYRLAMTYPVPPGDPAIGEYYSIEVARTFRDLSRVPLRYKDQPFGSFADLPDRKGHCDLVAVFRRPGPLPAWTAATFEKQGFLWFSLKDAAVLPCLMFWVENRGRHTPPWNGRNNCLGLEDVRGFFATGLADSARLNVIRGAGFPTTARLSPKRPTTVNYIQGVVKVPPGFGRVKTVRFGKGEVTFVSARGKCVATKVSYGFLRSGDL